MKLPIAPTSLLLLLVACGASSQELPRAERPERAERHDDDAATQRRIEEANRERSRLPDGPRTGPRPARPFAEYERTAWVAFSSGFHYDSGPAKRLIAAHLPRDVRLLVTVNDAREERATRDALAGLLEPERLSFVTNRPASSSGASFWSRDSLPLAVLDEAGSPFLVDARYAKGYEPDAQVAAHLGAPLVAHGYYYFGGNLLADAHGRCFRIRSPRGSGMPAATFRDHYGCRELTELEWIGGIGDVDERVKFFSDTVAVTDTPAYVPILRDKGFEVTLLPRPQGEGREYETYVNTLLVNGTLFVPIFDAAEDEAVLAAYRGLGVEVVPLRTRETSDFGHGNVHCFTMNYPAVGTGP